MLPQNDSEVNRRPAVIEGVTGSLWYCSPKYFTSKGDLLQEEITTDQGMHSSSTSLLRCKGVEALDKLQYRIDCRPIARSSADVMEADDALRVDKHIATPLIDISLSLLRYIAPEYLLDILPPGCRSPHIPETGSGKTEKLIQEQLTINGQGPLEVRFSLIIEGLFILCECDDNDVDATGQQTILTPPQLRQVRPAGQSGEMAVKDQVEPLAAIFFSGE